MFFPFRPRDVGLGIAAGIRAVTPAIQSWLSYRDLKWTSGRSKDIYAAQEEIVEHGYPIIGHSLGKSHGTTWTGRRGRTSLYAGTGIRRIPHPSRDAATMPRRYYKRDSRYYGGSGRRRNGYRSKRKTRRQRKRTSGRMYLNTGPISERRIGGKFIDFQIANQAISAIWTGANLDPALPIGCFSVAVQGVGGQERMGRNMKIKEISINGLLSSVAKKGFPEASARQVQVRLILFVDHNTNGAQPLAANIMETATLPADILAHYNLEGVGRYTILEDKTYTLIQTVESEGAPNAFATSSSNKTFHMGFTFGPYMKVRYQIGNPAAAISAVIDNSIHLIGVNNSPSFEVDLTYNARLRFVDGQA